MDLQILWFVLIAVLWSAYFLLEGFDFGVGMLLPFLPKDERERGQMFQTIGPVWDGNEVWLVIAGGATFAAFPVWYATMFSGFYLALLLILVALILRGVAFEFRGKINSDRWRRNWDLAIVVGSTVPALLWGVAFANIVQGVPLDEHHQYTGTLLTLLNPYALLGGLATLSLFALHGATFLALKTHGDVRVRANALVPRIGVPAIVLGGTFLLWTFFANDVLWTGLPVLVAAGALVAAVLIAIGGREGWAFVLTALAVVAVTVALFGSLYPDVLPSSTNPAFSLTTANASSTPYTLAIMSWVALAFTPLVLAYQAWTFWVFRRRISPSDIPAPTGLAPVAATPAVDPAADTGAHAR